MRQSVPRDRREPARFARSGYKIALCSNGTADYANGILGALGILDAIDYIQPALAGVNKSTLLARIMEHYATDRVVMVGDRHFDRTAARDNSVPFIGCGYGVYPAEIADAEFVVACADELPAAVERGMQGLREIQK